MITMSGAVCYPKASPVAIIPLGLHNEDVMLMYMYVTCMIHMYSTCICTYKGSTVHVTGVNMYTTQ